MTDFPSISNTPVSEKFQATDPGFHKDQPAFHKIVFRCIDVLLVFSVRTFIIIAVHPGPYHSKIISCKSSPSNCQDPFIIAFSTTSFGNP
jgi:hypothetical protein